MSIAIFLRSPSEKRTRVAITVMLFIRCCPNDEFRNDAMYRDETDSLFGRKRITSCVTTPAGASSGYTAAIPGGSPTFAINTSPPCTAQNFSAAAFDGLTQTLLTPLYSPF